MNSNLILLNRVVFTRVASVKYSTNVDWNIKVYNSLKKQKEPLKLKHNNTLYWYSCGIKSYIDLIYFHYYNRCYMIKGPTVYDSAHIGHASSYVSFDIIKRILANYFKINVVNLMNITDIDDKIIKKAIQQKKNFSEISTYYEKEFIEDLGSLNCIQPSIVLRVTEHIPEIIKFIQKLIESELAYATTSGSVYFNTQKFKVDSFFVPSKNVESEKDHREKLNQADFALWKAKKEENEPFWPSPWGNGRPGWHIECSTLATIGFGNEIDFHSGGKDLVFPHHHNELVQCCAYFNVSTWSSFWLHSGHLHLKNDVKMSKSLFNTISIREFLKSYNSNQFRLFCLLSPYRNDKEFSEEIMKKAVNLSTSFASFFNLCRVYCKNKKVDMPRLNINEEEVFKTLDETRVRIHEALCDDFNTCLVIDELFNLTNLINKEFQSIYDSNLAKTSNKSSNESDLNRHYGCVMNVCQFIESYLEMFGYQVENNSKKSASSMNTHGIVDCSLNFRSQIRNLALNKELNVDASLKKMLLSYCDQFRDDLRRENIEFKDLKGKTVWQFKTQ